MAASLHPAASHHLPAFIPAPDGTDYLMVAMAVLLVVAVLAIGLLFLRLHTLPERMAHRSHKLQFEICAVLGLLALFTHIHLFWVIGLLLALIDIPDFSGAFSRMARALEKIAGMPPDQDADQLPDGASAAASPDDGPKVQDETGTRPGKPEELSHA